MTDTVDQRVRLAREYLDSVRRRRVTELPLMLLVRECAELRRLLGQVLDVIGEAAVIPGAGRAAIVLAALGDASDGIRERAAHCPDCTASPADLCDETAGQLSRADAYDRLAATLREVTR
jgi:hypothetical protein